MTTTPEAMRLAREAAACTHLRTTGMWMAGKLETWCHECARFLPAAPTPAAPQAVPAQEAAKLREQLECVRQALPEQWRNSVPSVAVSTLVAELDAARAASPAPLAGHTAADWIASYGTQEQLMPRECKPAHGPRLDDEGMPLAATQQEAPARQGLTDERVAQLARGVMSDIDAGKFSAWQLAEAIARAVEVDLAAAWGITLAAPAAREGSDDQA